MPGLIAAHNKFLVNVIQQVDQHQLELFSSGLLNIKFIKNYDAIEKCRLNEIYEAILKHGGDFVDNVEVLKSNLVVGRDQEIQQCAEILSRQTKNNLLLIGEPGVGKTAIVKSLAQRIIHQDINDILSKRLIALDLEALFVGTSHRNELKERLKSILKQIKKFNGGIILFIDKIDLLFDVANQEGIIDAVNILISMLAVGELHCIGTINFHKYKKYNEKDSIFERYFQKIFIKELSVDDCLSILRSLKHHYEVLFGVQIFDSALVMAAQLSNCYIKNRVLPVKAIDLINEACVNGHVQIHSRSNAINKLKRQKHRLHVQAKSLSKEKKVVLKRCLKQVEKELKSLKLKNKHENQRLDELRKLKKELSNSQVIMAQAEDEKNLTLVTNMKDEIISDIKKKIAEIEQQITKENKQQQDRLLIGVVEPNIIIEIVNQWTEISITKLSETEYDRLLKLNENLHKKIIGQDDAINCVITSLINRVDISRENEPIGTFLFLGPNGVGKRELANSLGLELFNSIKSIISIDMNEYTESNSIIRFIDKLSNYVSFEQDSQLTETVQKQFNGIILFDEIEKAHIQIWNILLKILNNGCFIDIKDRIINFKNTIIIFTSNIGEQFILEENQSLSSTTENLNGKLSQTIKDHIMKEVRLQFRPEFLNCLNDIVFFQSLNINQYYSIIHLQIESLEERLKEQNIKINLTDKVIQSILKKFYNSVYGIHSLKQYFKKNITTEVSKLLIEMKVVPHNHITIDIDINDQYQYQFHIQELTNKSLTSSTSHSCHTYNDLNKKSRMNIYKDKEDDNKLSDYDDNKDLFELPSKRMKKS
ncbi:unnamed protein product [Rotaria sordida]|uniref:Uncharacterized protein n=1 Tax=Rotaria sordida TaxID=392033 RepID=A0A819N9Z7_9BILA|nr:unnamed protein product [Rotaria sordida]CAF3990446.1 unnamed protein product [Rotaria sordida]